MALIVFTALLVAVAVVILKRFAALAAVVAYLALTIDLVGTVLFIELVLCLLAVIRLDV